MYLGESNSYSRNPIPKVALLFYRKIYPSSWMAGGMKMAQATLVISERGKERKTFHISPTAFEWQYSKGHKSDAEKVRYSPHQARDTRAWPQNEANHM